MIVIRLHYLSLASLLSLAVVCLLGATPTAAQTLFASGITNPSGITQVADSRVLVTSSTKVTAFEADGTGRIDLPFDFSFLHGITQLQDGRVLVTASDKVMAFNADGTGLVETFANLLASGSGIIQLQDGRVLVLERTDQFESTVVAFNADGTGRTDFATVSFSLALTQIADGRVLVVGNGDAAVVAFNADGTGPTVFAKVLGPTGRFGICQLDDGRILITDTSGSVIAFDANGTRLTDFAKGLENPDGITQLDDGRVLVTENGLGNVWAYDPDSPTANELGTEIPSGITLDAVFPNPFTEATTVAYALAQASTVWVAVYDLLGRQVATLVDEHQAAGQHEVVFDGADLPAGVYIVRLESGGSVQTRRLTLTR